MRGIAAAVIGLVLLITLLILLTPAIGQALPGDGAGAFIYVSRQDVRQQYLAASRGRLVETSNLEIFMGYIDGRPPRNLTHHPATDHRPTLSPDGTLLAFQSDRAGNWEIYLADPRGGPAFNLTRHPASDIYPSWSPDGRLIAFLSYRDFTTSQPYVLEVEGQRVRQLTDLPADTFITSTPVWSPDGTRIAVADTRQDNGEPVHDLYTIDVATGALLLLATHEDSVMGIDWSPDGRAIAYYTQLWGTGHLFVIDAVGGDPRELLVQAEWKGISLSLPGVMHWSPDGRQLLFQAWVDDELMFDIFTLDMVSSRLHNLTQSAKNDANAVWFADGRQILFQSWRVDPGSAEIFWMRIPDDPDSPGLDVRRLTDYPYDDWEPQWMPSAP